VVARALVILAAADAKRIDAIAQEFAVSRATWCIDDASDFNRRTLSG
jgi:hypothetical protein